MSFAARGGGVAEVGGPDAAAAPAQPPAWEPGLLTRLVFDAVGVVVALGFAVLARDLGLGSRREPGAGLLPLVAAALVVACLFLDLLRTLARVRRDGGLRGRGRVPLGVVAVLAAIAAYLLLVEALGHLLTSVVVVAALLRVLGTRRLWVVALVALAAGLVSDALFTGLLGLRLPPGRFDVGWAAWT